MVVAELAKVIKAYSNTYCDSVRDLKMLHLTFGPVNDKDLLPLLAWAGIFIRGNYSTLVSSFMLGIRGLMYQKLFENHMKKLNGWIGAGNCTRFLEVMTLKGTPQF